MGRSVESLPPEKRAEHYRELANEAIRKAQKTPAPERRTEFLALAGGWHSMAIEAERLVAKQVSPEVDQPKVNPTPDLH
jgi:hypothetical protein